MLYSTLLYSTILYYTTLHYTINAMLKYITSYYVTSYHMVLGFGEAPEFRLQLRKQPPKRVERLGRKQEREPKKRKGVYTDYIVYNI